MFEKIYRKVVVFTSISLFLAFTIFGLSELYDIDQNIKDFEYIKKNTHKSLNIENIVSIFHCNSIRDSKTTKFFDKQNEVYQTYNKSNNIHLFGDIFIDTNNMSMNIRIDNINDILFVYIPLTKNKQKEIFIFMISLPIVLFFITYMIFYIIVEERKETIILNAGNEAIMTNKSMIMITENLHHELNTPLEIIDNKIEKIYNTINLHLHNEHEQWIIHNKKQLKDITFDEYKILEKRKINNALIGLDSDFSFIKTSSEQIYNILEKMKSFKHLRYSHKNETLYKIIENAFKMVSLSNTNYEYVIDKDLVNYKLDSNKLKNADLLNVIINHIKNSLEAQTTKLFIKINTQENNLMCFRIIDNGGGIPLSAQKKIFIANFSTKSNEDGVRGNGMYLNKHIIESGGGYIHLIETSSVGTTFQICVPINNK